MVLRKSFLRGKEHRVNLHRRGRPVTHTSRASSEEGRGAGSAFLGRKKMVGGHDRVGGSLAHSLSSGGGKEPSKVRRVFFLRLFQFYFGIVKTGGAQHRRGHRSTTNSARFFHGASGLWTHGHGHPNWWSSGQAVFMERSEGVDGEFRRFHLSKCFQSERAHLTD